MITAVVLAAGRGERMGSGYVKPLVKVGGQPILARVLAAIDRAGVIDVVVVLGASADAIRGSLRLDRRRIVLNPDPARGMGSSLALGLANTASHASGALVFHADMPGVQPETIRAVCRLATEGAALAAPSFDGQRGFPVFFSRGEIPAVLATLRGDEGGRRYLAAHRERLVVVDVSDPGCIRDIDRVTDIGKQEDEILWTTYAS